MRIRHRFTRLYQTGTIPTTWGSPGRDFKSLEHVKRFIRKVEASGFSKMIRPRWSDVAHLYAHWELEGAPGEIDVQAALRRMYRD